MNEIEKSLKSVFLFAALDDLDIKKLSSITKLQKYNKANALFYEGEPSEKLHILVEGIVKTYKTDMKNNEIVLHYFQPISVIAEMANFNHAPFPATSEFETDGAALKIDYAAFEREFLKNPHVSFGIIKSLTGKIKNLENIITRQLTLDATSRVAKFIYENEEEYRDAKRYKIASILNLTPETLSRIFKKLKQSNLISDDGKSFHITDREGLKRLFEMI